MKYIWKFFWFSIFLFVFPLISGIVGGLTINFVIGDGYIAFCIGFMIAIFVGIYFYRHYDKYRNNPFFTNQKKNLRSRIDIAFIISITSLLVPFMINIVSFLLVKLYLFEAYALISYILIYPSVFIYNFYKPIDYYNPSDKEFKNSKSFKLSMKMIYNNIYLVNYVVNILFLGIFIRLRFFYSSLILIYAIFYFITIFNTKKERNRILKLMEREEDFLKSLISFKKNMTKAIIGLIFSIVVFGSIVVIIEQGTLPSIFYGSLLVITGILLLYKTINYVNIHFESVLSYLENPIKGDDLS